MDLTRTNKMCQGGGVLIGSCMIVKGLGEMTFIDGTKKDK